MESIIAILGTKPWNWALFQSPELLQQDNDRWESKIPYLSLPGEIRNQIMEYALTPGEVYLATKADPAHWTGSKASMSGCEGPTSGCQLLATCKQVYREGCRAFYAGNDFHLPPGPVEGFLKWYQALRSEHREAIRNVTIDLSVLDLTPSVLEQCESVPRKRVNGTMTQSDYVRAKNDSVQIVLDTLRALWVQKIAKVHRLQAFDSVKLVALNLGGHPLSKRRTLLPRSLRYLKGDDIDQVLRPDSATTYFPLEPHRDRLSYYDGWNRHLETMVEYALICVREEIVLHFIGPVPRRQDFGWPRINRWMRDLEMTVRETEDLATIRHR